MIIKATVPKLSEYYVVSRADSDSPILPGLICAYASTVQLCADNPTNSTVRLPSVLPVDIAAQNPALWPSQPLYQ